MRLLHDRKFAWTALAVMVICIVPSTDTHCAQIIVGAPIADADGGVAVSVDITPESHEDVGALQFDLHYDANHYALADVASGAASFDAGKVPAFSVIEPGVARVLVTGLNVDTFAQGTVATAHFRPLGDDVAQSAFMQSIALQQAIASDPFGQNTQADVSYLQPEEDDSHTTQQDQASPTETNTSEKSEASMINRDEQPLMSLARRVLSPNSSGLSGSENAAQTSPGAIPIIPGGNSRQREQSVSSSSEVRLHNLDRTAENTIPTRKMNAQQDGSTDSLTPETQTAPPLLRPSAASGNVTQDGLHSTKIQEKPILLKHLPSVLASFVEPGHGGAMSLRAIAGLLLCATLLLACFLFGIWTLKRGR